MEKILIVGAGQGIGLQLAQHYSARGIVWGTYLNSTPDLGSERSFQLDLGDERSMVAMVEALRNAEVLFSKVIFVAAKTPALEVLESGVQFQSGMSKSSFFHYFEVNAFGPLVLFEYLYRGGLLKQPSTIVFLSSLAGSIGLRGRLPHNRPGGNLAYRISKSSLNCGVRNLAFDLAHQSITVVCLHPGWVRTKSGGPSADIDEVTAGRQIATRIDMLCSQDNGKFLNVDGTEIPW
ncbi:MAG: C-factor [Nitrosomonadaceae bacterium]|nr:C-factor [Nitrosomonadaceae bacterium]